MKSSDFYRKSDYKEYYKLLQFFMRICGLWPYQSFFAKYFFITMTIFLSEGILVGQLIEVIQIRSDLNEVIDCIPNLLISIIVGIEFIGLLFNSEKLKKCIDRIAEDWQDLSSNAEIKLLKAFTVQGQKLAFVYLFHASFTGFMFLLQPIVLSFNSDNSTNIISTIPFRVRYGIDIEKYYYEILFHCYVSVFSHLIILSSINLIYISFIQHACGLFSVIGYQLEHIGNEERLDVDLNIKRVDDNNYYIALNCLRKHIKVIEFVSILNYFVFFQSNLKLQFYRFSEFIDGSFSVSYLFNLGLFVLILAVSGTQVLMHTDQINEAVRYGSLFISILIQIFWQCWQAQRLLNCSNMPYEGVNQGHWYYTSTRCKKILTLIMIRSSKPCEITAMNLMTFSIETFSSLLRTAMSYFTVLQSIH
ncbi:odorant receptor 13a-like isoform X1 [Vespula pensylvanica]|uniref:odorant receptor 13a-like isoform X1 n=1 Tax=Vespula pensylvanica TaxID=30213 RepID=UPI001CBA5226|nr:odorant receptor 13a-like isoform X1 [Vespula pensylvanica]